MTKWMIISVSTIYKKKNFNSFLYKMQMQYTRTMR